MSETVSPQEVIWTLIAVIALGFTLWIIVDNAQNYRAVMAAVRRGNAVVRGPRWWVALASLVSSVAMLIVWGGFIGVGIVAMTTPPPATTTNQVASNIIGWILVGIEVVLAGIQVWQVYARTKIRPLVNPATDERAARMIASETASVAEAAAHAEVATIAAAASAAEASEAAHVVAEAAANAVDTITTEQEREQEREVP